MPSSFVRFSLRTLLIGLTLLCVALALCAYEMDWIRQRRAFIGKQFDRLGLETLIPFDLLYVKPRGPHLLWLCGERGVVSLHIAINVDDVIKAEGGYQIHNSHPEYSYARRLFPEATIVPVVQRRSVVSWESERVSSVIDEAIVVSVVD